MTQDSNPDAMHKNGENGDPSLHKKRVSGNKSSVRIPAFVALIFSLGSAANASVNIAVDFTQAEEARETLFDMWTVANRISPKKGVNVRPGMKVNTVRMLGGIIKRDKSRNKTKDPDLRFDICSYDEKAQKYAYHFERLTDRINKIRSGGTGIYQIVLDQPPWAFQRGYTFIPEGERDGVHFRENERVSHYGNSLPPADKEAYAAFIKALMQHLIAEYGQALVKTWRFRVGSEIETPEHWHGTEKDFIEHFANTVAAVRSVLPDAIIGLHTRAPDYVFRKDNFVNYKGEQVKSFAKGIIEYCYDNNIRYDFWGISDYPNITEEKSRKPREKFVKLFEPLVTHPKWFPGTIIDLEEFSVITHMGPILISETAQADTFQVAMTDNFYRNGVNQVFQWNQRVASDERWRTELFKGMVGKVRYREKITSKVADQTEAIGAIIVKSPTDESIDAVLYHYDPTDLDAETTKEIQLRLTTNFPVGSRIAYRKTLSGKEQNKFNQFMANPSSPSWLKKKRSSKYGNAHDCLNEIGKTAWKNYENPSSRKWTESKVAETLATPDGSPGSIITIDTRLPLFSFEKIEISRVR